MRRKTPPLGREKCRVPDCKRVAGSRGLCTACYAKARRGDETALYYWLESRQGLRTDLAAIHVHDATKED